MSKSNGAAVAIPTTNDLGRSLADARAKVRAIEQRAAHRFLSKEEDAEYRIAMSELDKVTAACERAGLEVDGFDPSLGLALRSIFQRQPGESIGLEYRVSTKGTITAPSGTGFR